MNYDTALKIITSARSNPLSYHIGKIRDARDSLNKYFQDEREDKIRKIKCNIYISKNQRDELIS